MSEHVVLAALHEWGMVVTTSWFSSSCSV